MEPSPEDAIKLLKEKGKEAFETGNFLKALNLYTEAISIESESESLYANRSFCNLKLGKLDEAMSDALKAVALQPTWSKGHYRVGEVFWAMKNPEEAIAYYQQALELV